jgi:hypothetical protein
VIAADFDNNGWADIFMVNGHLTSEIDAAKSDATYRQRKLLYSNLQDGRFEDVTPVSGPDIMSLHSSRGAAAAVPEGPAPNHWIGIRLMGTKSNRDGIGSRVEIESGALRQMDEVRSGASYLSQSDLRLHLGLGAARRVDRLTVRWPSGTVDTVRGIAADHHVLVKEGSGIWQNGK